MSDGCEIKKVCDHLFDLELKKASAKERQEIIKERKRGLESCIREFTASVLCLNFKEVMQCLMDVKTTKAINDCGNKCKLSPEKEKEVKQKVLNQEASMLLDNLIVGVKSAFASDSFSPSGKLLPHKLPIAKTGWVPGIPCCKGANKQCTPEPKAWSKEPWKSFHFKQEDPHNLQLRYTSNGKKVTIEARGDPTCSGKFQVFSVTSEVKGEEVVFQPVRGLTK